MKTYLNSKLAAWVADEHCRPSVEEKIQQNETGNVFFYHELLSSKYRVVPEAIIVICCNI